MLRFTLRAFLTLSLLAAPLPVEAGDACPSAPPTVDRLEWWDFSKTTRSDFLLLSRGSHGLFETQAAAHLEWNKQLDIRFDYRLPEGEAGLEYTLDHVVIDVGRGAGSFHFEKDFTAACSSPGRSMFPGQAIKLAPVKVPPGFLGFPRGREIVRVRIWGHL